MKIEMLANIAPLRDVAALEDELERRMQPVHQVPAVKAWQVRCIVDRLDVEIPRLHDEGVIPRSTSNSSSPDFANEAGSHRPTDAPAQKKTPEARN